MCAYGIGIFVNMELYKEYENYPRKLGYFRGGGGFNISVARDVIMF